MLNSVGTTQTFSISELAEEFGVTSRALRLYQEEGLLQPEREGTKRVYSERCRVRLRLILRGKRLGWSLSEIRDSFDLYDSGLGEEGQLVAMLGKLEQRAETLQSQRDDVEHALEELAQIMLNARRALKQIRSNAKQKQLDQE